MTATPTDGKNSEGLDSVAPMKIIWYSSEISGKLWGSLSTYTLAFITQVAATDGDTGGGPSFSSSHFSLRTRTAKTRCTKTLSTGGEEEHKAPIRLKYSELENSLPTAKYPELFPGFVKKERMHYRNLGLTRGTLLEGTLL